MDHPDNASLLTNATMALERCRSELTAVESEIATLQVKRETLTEIVAILTGRPRVRRQRAPRLVETPQEAPQPELEGVA